MIRQSKFTENARLCCTPSGRPVLRRYVVAVIFVLAAAALIVLPAWLASLPLLMLFIAAIAVAQAYGGLGPGLLATVMGLIMGVYLFVPPFFTWSTKQNSKSLRFFYAFALVFGWLYSQRTRYRLR